jgi:uncharacterized OsmC-like protein
MPTSKIDIRARQASLRQRYLEEPGAAVRTLRVQSGASDVSDPLHVEVVPASVPAAVLRSGAHPAVGGEGDVPCPADILLAALAACQETTVRMVAANMGIDLRALEVTAEGDWDPRGTLAMGREYPVGLSAARVHTRVVVSGDERGERAEKLLRSAERYCVVLDTLRRGLPVEATFELEQADA